MQSEGSLIFDGDRQVATEGSVLVTEEAQASADVKREIPRRIELGNIRSICFNLVDGQATALEREKVHSPGNIDAQHAIGLAVDDDGGDPAAGAHHDGARREARPV